jgi:hypothetical protein
MKVLSLPRSPLNTLGGLILALFRLLWTTEGLRVGGAGWRKVDMVSTSSLDDESSGGVP